MTISMPEPAAGHGESYSECWSHRSDRNPTDKVALSASSCGSSIASQARRFLSQPHNSDSTLPISDRFSLIFKCLSSFIKSVLGPTISGAPSEKRELGRVNNVNVNLIKNMFRFLPCHCSQHDFLSPHIRHSL